MTAADVEAGIRAALIVSAINADVVAVEARRHAAAHPIAVAESGADVDCHLVTHEKVNVQRVISLTQRRLTDPAAVIAGLPADKRPLPSVNAYDELLTKRRQITQSTLEILRKDDAS